MQYSRFSPSDPAGIIPNSLSNPQKLNQYAYVENNVINATDPKRVCASLSFWMGYFPNAKPESFLFPFHQVGIAGDSRAVTRYDIDLAHPMGQRHHKKHRVS